MSNWKRWKKLPRDRQVAIAHREVLRELGNCIPWAPPAIARELQRRYRRAFDAR